jgi:hypothetical protein
MKFEQFADLPKLTVGCVSSLGKPEANHFRLSPPSAIFKLLNNEAFHTTKRSSCDFDSGIEQLIESLFPDVLTVVVVIGTQPRYRSAKAVRLHFGEAGCQGDEWAVGSSTTNGRSGSHKVDLKGEESQIVTAEKIRKTSRRRRKHTNALSFLLWGP